MVGGVSSGAFEDANATYSSRSVLLFAPFWLLTGVLCYGQGRAGFNLRVSGTGGCVGGVFVGFLGSVVVIDG